ncbi:hypothetical protein G9F72_014270 [Clostridium estertheticum]|uniref:hypothetical protein n=1 Tax=Clostridium estertheticum TaxID=238834 RepID=UPI0013E90502|nr:hypothetical protein [Clostridium estertheticum]MBZ9687493.1 hypothetical protein [Clostridium estertheticum]
MVNESDYNFIKEQKKSYELGKFQLYNFNNWKATKAIVDELKSDLEITNKTTKELFSPFNSYESMLEVASKIFYRTYHWDYVSFCLYYNFQSR